VREISRWSNLTEAVVVLLGENLTTS
jgi:hypothetical protein